MKRDPVAERRHAIDWGFTPVLDSHTAPESRSDGMWQRGTGSLFCTCRRSATRLAWACRPRTKVQGYRISSLRD